MLRKAIAHPRATLMLLTHDPCEVWHKVRDRVGQYSNRAVLPTTYIPDPEWEARLHQLLNAPWPCQESERFRELWPQIMKRLREQGVDPGPLSLYGWNDGDPELARAIWCAVCHLCPKDRGMRVVETGVAHGVTSRVILEALCHDERNHLWSIDVPPHDPAMRRHTGMAVEDNLRPLWTYIEGSSRRRLPALLKELGSIDLFIHDSIHTQRNVVFELQQAWSALRPGGCMVVDDIDSNWGFHFFSEFQDCVAMVCQSEPLRPDPRRSDHRGLFGIIWKMPLSPVTASAGADSIGAPPARPPAR
jgi:hypothetical protein